MSRCVVVQLVLNGKLSVSVGSDELACEAGPWTVLGAESLAAEEGRFTSGTW